MAQPFTKAWMAGQTQARSLLPRVYDAAEGRRAAVNVASTRRVHPAVLKAVETVHPAQTEALARLEAGGACAVVTGQQAGLFGGPLYTVYKAVAAIVNAQALAEETGVPCVPVFWLQNEDHDFEEIRHAEVPDRRGTLHRFSVEATGDGSASVAERRLTDSVQVAMDGLRALVEDAEHGAEAIKALDGYRMGASPDRAFVSWLNALFARFGLLVVNPRHPEIRAAARPLHERAIAEHVEIERVLSQRVEALSAASFRVQVYVRPDAPLSFVHLDGPEGPRHRFERDGSSWRVAGADRTLTDAELKRAHFSTSALLRPVLQDTLLPTVAYVGGPGEIAYFAQLPPLYAHFGIPMPMVVPRARVRVLDAGARRLLDQLGLVPTDLDGDPTTLRARVSEVPEGCPSPDALEAAVVGAFRAALSDLGPALASVDPTLGTAVDKTDQGVVRSVQKLSRRYADALARRDSVTHDRLDRLLERLCPAGAPQERIHSWPAYGARLGVDGFVDAVARAVRPFDGTLVDLGVE